MLAYLVKQYRELITRLEELFSPGEVVPLSSRRPVTTEEALLELEFSREVRKEATVVVGGVRLETELKSPERLVARLKTGGLPRVCQVSVNAYSPGLEVGFGKPLDSDLSTLRGFTTKLVDESTIVGEFGYQPGADRNHKILILSLGGLWRDETGTVYRITHSGATVSAIMEEVPRKVRTTWGFRDGDSSFNGILEEDLVRGEVKIHAVKDLKARCPSQWERWVEFELMASQDNRELRGRWKDLRLNRDCTVYDAGWRDWNLKRLDEVPSGRG